MSNYRRAKVKGGTYFFTVITHLRQPYFQHQQAREALREALHAIRIQHPFQIDAWVLLPDHLHCIWTLPEDDADFALRWSLIKRSVSKNCLALIDSNLLTPAQWKNNEFGFWQRRYWEHQIRNENDYARHVDYLHWNPVKHGYVDGVKEWPYSTFHRFVDDGVYSLDWGITTKVNNDSAFGEWWRTSPPYFS